MKSEKVWKRRRAGHMALVTLALVLLGLFLWFLAEKSIGVPCVFYRLTGLLCPGCGNTRATLALLSGEPLAALRQNLLFPLEALYLLWVYGCCVRSYIAGSGFRYRSPAKWLDVLFLVLLLLWWILRNL